MKSLAISIFTALVLAPCSYAILDVNENGVSDLWERDFNNGSLFDGSFDPYADDDSDGWSNVKEAAAGTNPFNPNPPDGLVQPLTGHSPEVSSEPDEYGHSYVITPEAVTVSWPTLVGKQYTLLFSPDLSAGSWLSIGSAFIGNGNEVTYGFTISESDKRFWRVAVNDVDSDNDGLTDHEEFLYGTNPATADSDGDGMSDYLESINGFNPNNSSDAGIDTDNDGLSNLQELILGTDPNSPDDHSDVGDEAVVNGNFSEPAIFVPGPDGKGTTGLEATKGETGWNYWAGIPGWKAVQGENVELQTFATGPEDPNVELKAEPEGHRGIQQWIKTRVGVSYLVMFKALPRPYIGDGSLNNFEVYAGEERIKEITYTGEVDPDTVAWETHTAVFTAQQVLTKLSFVVPESNPDNTLGCIVDEIVFLPVEIAVDANRNGEVEFGIDQTTVETPYSFWINNDQDKGNDDEADDLGPDSDEFIWPDCEDNIVNDLRDLEDFARIQLKVPGVLLDQLKSGDVKIALKFKNGTTEGSPAINIRPHYDVDGGRAYVEDEAEGLKHVGDPSLSIYEAFPWRITKEEEYVFQMHFWTGSGLEHYPEATEAKPDRYLLFEGSGVGKGELVLEFRKGNDVLGEGASCWIELKDIKDMYEEYTVAGIYGKSWQEINQINPTADTDDLSDSDKALYTTFELPEVFEYPLPDEDAPDYEKDYILFVHGWRMKPSEKYVFAETAFKRLWHRGYRGRFGTFSWPTEWTDRHSPLAVPDGILWDPRNYDRSDRKAYLSGTALNSLLHRLNGIYPGRVRTFAHSMGNVVVSQALRVEAKKVDAKEVVHTYAACQAASVAFAYDADNPRTMTPGYILAHPQVTGAVLAGATLTAPESPHIPEVYGHFPYVFPETREYFTGIDGVVTGNIANVHNWTDSALAAWMVGQWQKPDLGWGYSDLIGDGVDGPVWWRQDGMSGRQVLSLYSEAPEVLAHIAEAKSPALGASVEGANSTQNVIKQNLDTMTAFSENQKFEGNDEDHSAQFRSINMRRWEFWDRLLRDPFIFNIQTDYPKDQ